MRRFCAFWGLLVALLFVNTSCRSVSSSPSLGDHPVRVYLDLEKAHFQPGEAVVAEVFLANVTGAPLAGTVPNAESITFWLSPAGEAKGVEVEPVRSPKEDLRAAEELASDDLWRRTFVLPAAALTSGTFTLQASYDSNPHRSAAAGWQAVSKAREFSVTGEMKFARDRDGVLLSEEARRVAGRFLGGEWAIQEDRLIRNEMGFLDWVVVATHSQTGERRVVLVNPYLGGVRTEMEPSLLRKKRQELPPPVFPRRDG